MDVAFTGEIWHWRGPSPYYFVTVPEEQSDDLREVAGAVTYGWGMIPVGRAWAIPGGRRRCSPRTGGTSCR